MSVDEVNRYINAELPFCAAFGISCDELAQGEALMRWRHAELWTRPGGEQSFVCGPVMMALADVAIYVAIFTVAGITPLALTNELKTNFLRPAADGDLLCRGRLVKAGRRVAYGVADVFAPGGEDRLVAQATCSYVMPDPAP